VVARWADVEAEAPEFAEAVKGFLEARKHKTLATLRRDGSPRISGTEADIVDGDLWFGSMPGARKAQDLRRDPRFALHTGSEDPPEWRGDAKVSGRVEEVDDPERRRALVEAQGNEPAEDGSDGSDFHLFRADITEVALVRLGEPADHLVIQSWREGDGLKRTRR
jgi:general stress protein 26